MKTLRSKSGRADRRSAVLGPGMRAVGPLVVLLLGIVPTGAALGAAARSPEVARWPAAADTLRADSLRVDGRSRRFAYRLPPGGARGAPVVLALHASGGDGARLRGFIGAELERLADERGLAIVYPDGVEGHWNDCRARAPFRANTEAIDDPVFLRALVRRLAREHGIDSTRVGALGFSNGGHMALRLALESPEVFPAVVVFGATLPVADELDCRVAAGRPASVMFVHGTGDPVAPFDGGEVRPPDGRTFGRVRSVEASAAYFAERAAAPSAPARTGVLPAAGPDSLAVELWRWDGAAVEARVYVIRGGGHTIPFPGAAFPGFLGPTETRLNAVDEAVRFILDRRARSTQGPPPVGIR